VRFQKGTSGNPHGRPKGALDKLTVAARKLANRLGPQIIKKLGDDAVAGDRIAASLFLRYCVPRKSVDVISFAMPQIGSASDVPKAIAALLAAMAAGEISPADAMAVVSTLEAYGRSLVYDAHEQRLASLEALLAGGEVVDTAASAHENGRLDS
jgi:hypothetical protein